MLLKAKANPNAHDRNGNTALMEAAARGFQNVAKALLEAGVSFNLANKEGLTALAIAQKSGRYQVAGILTAFGAK